MWACMASNEMSRVKAALSTDVLGEKKKEEVR